MDAKGRLIGINTAIISRLEQILEWFGSVNMVRRALIDYMKKERSDEDFLEFLLQKDVDDNGPVVESVVNGSAADKAGFLPGDKIVKVERSCAIC